MNNERHIAVRVRHADPLLAAGLEAILSPEPDLMLADGLARSNGPGSEDASADVVVADYEQGLLCAKRYPKRASARAAPGPRVLIVTARTSELDVRNALQAGVHGYLVQGCTREDALHAVRTLARGARYLCAVAATQMASSISHSRLTGRESEVLDLLAEGLNNKRIASRLDVSVGTIKSHIQGILSKLDASSRTHAVHLAVKRGLVQRPQ